jgi:thioredoxin 1
MTASDRPLEDELARLREQKLRRYARLAKAKAGGPEFPEKPIDADADAAAKLIRKYPMALLEFWAAWCRPCITMRPVIEELAAEYWGDVAFLRVDLDRSPDARDLWGVTVLPTMIITKQGLEVARLHGAYTRARLVREIEPLAENPDTRPTIAGRSTPPGEKGE